MRREVFSVFADEYMLAKGGWNAMYPADIDALTLILNEQYSHLQGFATDVSDGTLSKSQISARSELYMGSATQAHERGKARRHNLILPAYPADGSQICRSNCKCKWIIREDDEMGCDVGVSAAHAVYHGHRRFLKMIKSYHHRSVETWDATRWYHRFSVAVLLS